MFYSDNDYRSSKKRVDGLEEKLNGGSFVLNNGTVVGKHRGYPFYTIGQRKGLEVALGKPMYVTGINAEENQVVLGEKEELKRHEMLVYKTNLSKYDKWPNGLEVITKIRHHDVGQESQVFEEEGKLKVVFYGGAYGVAIMGQSAVFYEGEDVIGGGIIYSGNDTFG